MRRRSEGPITALDTTITGVSRAALKATRVRLVRSSVTGAGGDPNCNTLNGFNFFLCGDVLAFKKPTVRLSTCTTSLELSSHINLLNPEDWDACTTD